MQTRRYRARVRRLLALAAVTLLLTACEAPPYYGPSPTPSVEPFFANKEEVLDAFDAFMQEYVVAVTTMVLSDGVDQSALARLVTKEQLEQELAVLDQLREQDLKFEGEFGYFRPEIQQFNQDSASEAYVQAYVCVDYRATRYVRADGSIFEGNTEWYPAEAILYANQTKRLTLHELRRWSGRDFCAP